MKQNEFKSNISKIFFWKSQSLSDHKASLYSIAIQTVMVGLFALMIVFLFNNYITNIAQRNITIGFGFLDDTASFSIGQTLIDYDPSDSYFRVYLVGLLNTLFASFIAIVIATVLGVIIGLFLLSNNVLLKSISEYLIEIIRNLPPLLHVLFWYIVVVQRILPDFDKAISFFDIVFLSIKGMTMPGFVWHQNSLLSMVLLVCCVVAIIGMLIYSKKKALQGKPVRVVWWNVLLLSAIVLILLFVPPFDITLPVKGKFSFTSGFTLYPELFALVAALAFYTSGYIAIILRSSILAIPKNQIEASHSLGLNYFQRVRYIIMPLALRSMIPPLTNQYLNIIKNSSLASAVGYSDIVAVFAGTALNQSGRALEIMTMVMLTYFLISAFTSFLMNMYNKKVLT